jgi:zinc protease
MTRNKFSAAALTILLAATWTLPALAAVDRSKKPEPGPAPEAAFPDFTTKTLANGLKVFVIQDDRKPSVTFRLLIKGGSSVDGDKAGLGGFVGTLLNRGTKTRDMATFARECDYIGSQIEAVICWSMRP